MRPRAHLRVRKRGALLMETLKHQILDHEPSATLRAKQLGRAANPTLLELMKNPDPLVRQIALSCLKETGGPEPAKAFLAALGDEDVQVAGVGVDGLGRIFDPALVPQILQAYDKAYEGLVREGIALLAGRGDKATDPKELQKRQATEQDPQAREGLLVALARLGEKPSQEEFVRRLQAAHEWELQRFLTQHCLYINQAWLLKPLLPLLDRKENLIHYGVDARPELDVELRACDVTVNVAAKLSQRKFSFKIEEYQRYPDAAIDEVRRFLKSLP